MSKRTTRERKRKRKEITSNGKGILISYYCTFTIFLFFYFSILLFFYFFILLFLYFSILLFLYFTIFLFSYFSILLFFYISKDKNFLPLLYFVRKKFFFYFNFNYNCFNYFKINIKNKLLCFTFLLTFNIHYLHFFKNIF